MKHILFQGDSITDCGRSREDLTDLAKGYPCLVAARMGFENPGAYRFTNRGVSGNRIVDVYARIKVDILNLKPDVMSILIGINDVWHEVGNQNGVSADKFEKIYGMLIEEVKAELPDIKIMILEPFVTKSTASAEKWEYFHTETVARAAAAKRVAEKYGLVFVPLQAKFDEACALTPEPYWTREGVHPTPFGHELIAREWIKAYQTL